MVTIKEEYNPLEYILLGLIFLFIIACLLTPLVLSSSTFFPFIVGKAVVSRISIELAFAFWLILAYKFPQYRPKHSLIIYAFIIWIFITVITAITGVSIQRSLWSSIERMQGIIDLIHWFIFVLILVSIFKTGTNYKENWIISKKPLNNVQDISKIFNWRILISINAAVSLFMALMSIDLYYSLDKFFTYQSFNYLDESRRIIGTLGNPTFVGAYMLVNIFLVAGLFFQSIVDQKYLEKNIQLNLSRLSKTKRKNKDIVRPNFLLLRSFWIISLIFNFWVLILTETRGAIFVGLPVGITIILIGTFLWHKHRGTILINISKILLFLIVILAIALIFARDSEAFNYLAKSNDLINRVKNVNLDDPSIKGRISSHAAGFRAVLDRPIFGYGPENYIVAWGQNYTFDRESYEVYDQAHNKILEEMSTKGVLGLLSYTVLWVLMFLAVYNKTKNKENREQLFNLFLLGALGSYFAQNIFLFDTPSTVLQFSLLVALVIYVDDGFTIRNGDFKKLFSIKYIDVLIAKLKLKSNKLGIINLDRMFMLLTCLFCVLIIIVGIWINSKIYFSTKLLLDAHSIEPKWEEKISKYEDSINMFPPLANYPRKFSFHQIEKNLINMSQTDFNLVMNYVDREANKLLQSEPMNWAIFGDLTRLYREALRVDLRYEKNYYQFYNLSSDIAPSTLKIKYIMYIECKNSNSSTDSCKNIVKEIESFNN
mgnify:CR=1 FL=1